MSSLFVKWLDNFCKVIETSTSNWWLDCNHLSYLSLKLFVALLSPRSIPPMLYPATTPTISATPPPSHIFVARPSPPVLIVPSPPSSRDHFRSTCTRAQIRNLYIPTHWHQFGSLNRTSPTVATSIWFSSATHAFSHFEQELFLTIHPGVAFLVCFGRLLAQKSLHPTCMCCWISLQNCDVLESQYMKLLVTELVHIHTNPTSSLPLTLNLWEGKQN